MKKTVSLLLAVAIVSNVFLSIGLSAPVQAQTSPSPTPSAATKNELEAKLQPLREKYKTQLSIYRTDERAQQLAKEQYAKLGTLAALEVAVKSTQKVLQTRTDVLLTYFEMLRLTVEATPGIDINEKSDVLDELTAVHDRLKQHQELVKLAVDRTQLDKAVKDFNALSAEMVTITYKALSYRSYGKMQSVYDKTFAIKNEITTALEAQEKSGLRLGEKRRALDEIDRGFDTPAANLAKIRSNLLPERNGRNRTSQSSFDNMTEDLGIIYADMYKLISFFREVEKS